MDYARILIALLALASSLSPAPTPTVDKASATPDHRHATTLQAGYRLEPWYADYPATRELDGATAHAQTPEQVADLQWALDRYAAAGLNLPYVEVWLHDKWASCSGTVAQGVSGYTTWREGLSIVMNCGTRHTLLHELGHVWDRHALSDADRAAFMALRSVTEWQDETWLQAGQEHLADVMAWALTPECDRHAQTAPRDEAAMAAAYELATGLQPLPCESGNEEGRPD